MTQVTIYTLGHSNRSGEALVAILQAHRIELLADVRTIPRSRHNPQFNAEELQRSLPSLGIAYLRLPRLGGLRRPRKDSRNLAWRNEGFRGFADYMETAEFEEGLRELLALAGERRTAILCAEALYWRCHRSLVSDALVARGHRVVHILTERKTEPHRLSRLARIEDGRLSYPPEQPPLAGT
jgi:uncharacterized protein (DUF488 family)